MTTTLSTVSVVTVGHGIRSVPYRYLKDQLTRNKVLVSRYVTMVHVVNRENLCTSCLFVVTTLERLNRCPVTATRNSILRIMFRLISLTSRLFTLGNSFSRLFTPFTWPVTCLMCTELCGSLNVIRLWGRVLPPLVRTLCLAGPGPWLLVCGARNRFTVVTWLLTSCSLMGGWR